MRQAKIGLAGLLDRKNLAVPESINLNYFIYIK